MCHLDPGELQFRQPSLGESEDEQQALAFLDGCVNRLAHLAASWRAVGLRHGMVRSDNVPLHGFTLDLGSVRFMRRWEPRPSGAALLDGGLRATIEESPAPPKETMYSFVQQTHAIAVHVRQLAVSLSPLVRSGGGGKALLESHLRRFWPAFRQHHACCVGAMLHWPPAQDEAQRWDDHSLCCLLERQLHTFFEADASVTYYDVLSRLVMMDDAAGTASPLPPPTNEGIPSVSEWEQLHALFRARRQLAAGSTLCEPANNALAIIGQITTSSDHDGREGTVGCADQSELIAFTQKLCSCGVPSNKPPHSANSCILRSIMDRLRYENLARRSCLPIMCPK
jgi:hypothetical protein